MGSKGCRGSRGSRRPVRLGSWFGQLTNNQPPPVRLLGRSYEIGRNSGVLELLERVIGRAGTNGKEQAPRRLRIEKHIPEWIANLPPEFDSRQEVLLVG